MEKTVISSENALDKTDSPCTEESGRYLMYEKNRDVSLWRAKACLILKK